MAFKDAEDAEVRQFSIISSPILSFLHVNFTFQNHAKESEDCFKIALSNESSDLIAELENLHEDHDDKSLIKIEINDDISQNIGAETSVDEIVNETLAKTGIVSLPVDIMPKPAGMRVNNDEEISNEDHMKALLAEVEVAGVKLMLTEDGTLSGILENHEETESKESASKDNPDNINDLLQASNIKDLLENVGSTLGSEENESATDQAADVENKNDGNESQGNDKDSDTKTIRNTRIYTEEELLSQLTDDTKKLITAVKIKVVYRCEYCEKWEKPFYIYGAKVYENIMWYISFCRTFCTKDALNTHRKVHDGLRNPFICNICNAAFSTFAR